MCQAKHDENIKSCGMFRLLSSHASGYSVSDAKSSDLRAKPSPHVSCGLAKTWLLSIIHAAIMLSTKDILHKKEGEKKQQINV